MAVAARAGIRVREMQRILLLWPLGAQSDKGAFERGENWQADQVPNEEEHETGCRISLRVTVVP